MTVKVSTEHGSMMIDLDQFFPAPRAKVRKLFRLMDAGMGPEAKEIVRAWLVRQKENAEGKVSLFAEYILHAEQNVAKQEQEIAKLKEALQGEKARIAEMKRGAKAAERTVRDIPAWIEDFETICGKER